MKRDWQADELAEQWTLLPGERELLANKTGATRLGFALLPVRLDKLQSNMHVGYPIWKPHLEAGRRSESLKHNLK